MLDGHPLNILFIALPPCAEPRRGYELRTYHQLRHLGRRHRITLVTFASNPTTHPDWLPDACAALEAVAYRPTAAASAVLRFALRGDVPFQSAIYALPEMRHRVAAAVATGAFDVVHIQLSRLAPMYEAAVAAIPVRVPTVLDMVDPLGLNMARRAELEPNLLKRAAARVEARRLARFESDVRRRFDRVLLVSPADARDFGPDANVVVNPCGVDLPAPLAHPVRDPERIIFSGNLGYFANVDAIRWWLSLGWPEVRRVRPQAHLVLAGARPDRIVRRLARTTAGVRLLGDVPDLAGEIARSSVAIAPIRAGSGQSLKVLEAMANGTPVVATTRAIDGLAVDPDRHLLVADDPLDFARAVDHLLREPARAAALARAALTLVAQQYSWERSVEQLESVYYEAIASHAR